MRLTISELVMWAAIIAASLLASHFVVDVDQMLDDCAAGDAQACRELKGE